jgi:hypothetical protein
MPIYIEHLIAELLREHGGKLVSVMEPEIRAIVQAAVDQERERALKKAAQSVSHMFIDPNAIHPDIAFHEMNETAQVVAHTTAQSAARIILDMLP